MIAKAEAKYVRLPASKARLLIDLVKGKTIDEALFILEGANKRAGRPLKKVISSAFSNANQNREEKLLEKEVIISRLLADNGPYFMRFRAATMGRAAPIRHRTSHLIVELDYKKKLKKEGVKKNGTKGSSN